MAHPKRRTSSAVRDKRRTHYKLTPKAVTACQTTGELHLRHKAYVVDGDLYLNGKVAIKDYAPVASAAAPTEDEE
ncbi:MULTISPECIES: 50S ribosomal protein L32 [Hymenobacter]|uniref:Large ribosomal subunit protein bL32 n=2 Tax=Hymenobacter TaxID=89966 RepID=A0ABS6WXJ4_9BACT|nr:MULTISPECIES: 50S ribosomal protein L32 [Hymenobacter]MBO3269355.1 50S ribosomal protein L32 [Hymenobacter defluvii]MBW3128313.1 50S ribosomal protein L32 [Hymenobacter profundi]QNE39032.1 50S ribosomal protein L32 [Hymenobacter sp. NBH84]